jgi:hypothetical protein
VGRDHVEHLFNALREDYEAVSCNWKGELFCGITLDWDYNNKTVKLSMPNYIEEALLATFSTSKANTGLISTASMQHTAIWSKSTNDGRPRQVTTTECQRDAMHTTNRWNTLLYA